MTSLFGPMEPVPPQRIRALRDGDTISFGLRSLDVIATPGHASHQVALVDSDTGAIFTGDALGIHVPDVPVLRPATPPPDFDVELTAASIERIRARARSVLLFAHFGPIGEIDRVCDLAIARTRAWTEVVRSAMRRTDDLDEIVALLEQEAARDAETGAEAPIDLQRFEILSSIRMNAMGIMRYWKKRAEREAVQPPS
jgi:glyoxylase-like metal-dependent hydrolase (beta-lactamase superfamily II)